MEDTDIINLWKLQDAKIEQALEINKYVLKEVIGQKARSAMRSLTYLLSWGIVLFILYLGILGNLLVWAISDFSPGLICFILSLSVIFLINIKGLSDYIKHVYLVKTISYDGRIAETQKSLVLLQLSVIQHTRTMFLQVPFFSTLFLNINLFVHPVNLVYIIFQVTLTGVLVYGTYQLYRNLTIDNLDKRWLQVLISGTGGKAVMKALVFYREIEAFEQGNSL